jgi:hypothetical protein
VAVATRFAGQLPQEFRRRQDRQVLAQVQEVLVGGDQERPLADRQGDEMVVVRIG